MTEHFVTVVPDGGWWMATFYAAPTELDIYVDITTPATWFSDAHVTSVDLDLDVVRYRADGRVVVADEDEFDEHTVSYGYPDDLVRAARESATHIVDAVTSRREPFGEVGFAWLGKL